MKRVNMLVLAGAVCFGLPGALLGDETNGPPAHADAGSAVGEAGKTAPAAVVPELKAGINSQVANDAERFQAERQARLRQLNELKARWRIATQAERKRILQEMHRVLRAGAASEKALGADALREQLKGTDGVDRQQPLRETDLKAMRDISDKIPRRQELIDAAREARQAAERPRKGE